MARDPLQLTDENVEEIVSYLRSKRDTWMKEEIANKSIPRSLRTPKDKKAAAPKKIAAPSNLSLDDLFK